MGRQRRPELTLLVFVLGAILVLNPACGDKKKSPSKPETSLVRVDLPGFALLLPPGSSSAESGSDGSLPSGTGQPAPDRGDTASVTGQHEVHRPAGRDGSIRVVWEPGPERSPEELEGARDEIAEATGPVVRDESLEFNGVPGLTSTIGLAGGGFMGLSLLHCPGYGLQVAITSWVDIPREEHEALHRRIATSLECKPAPDGGPVALPTAVFPAFEAPKGFGYLRGSEPPTFLGVDETFYAFEHRPVGRLRDFEQIRADLYRWARGEGLVIADMDLWDTVHRGLGGTPVQIVMARLATPDRDQVTLFLAMLECKAHRVSFDVRYLAGPDVAREAGAARLTRVGCPGPEAVELTGFPTVEEVFTAACDRKNGRACKLLGDLLADGEVEVPGASPAALDKRACKLGYKPACP